MAGSEQGQGGHRQAHGTRTDLFLEYHFFTPSGF
jgi:hypothetical protein